MLQRNILQLKPANPQCKLFILRGSLISGIKTGSILGKASFKLSDYSLLFSTALIDTIKVKCFLFTTSLKIIDCLLVNKGYLSKQF